jgi:hypothetical protein
MTPQEAKELLPIIEAYANGETVQIHDNLGEWFDADHPIFNMPSSNYRIKPKPRLVEVTHEDLPPVFWVQEVGDDRIYLVTVIHPDGDLETEHVLIKRENLRNWRWSPDRKTWQDFTKEVAE